MRTEPWPQGIAGISESPCFSPDDGLLSGDSGEWCTQPRALGLAATGHISGMSFQLSVNFTWTTPGLRLARSLKILGSSAEIPERGHAFSRNSTLLGEREVNPLLPYPSWLILLTYLLFDLTRFK